MAHLERNGVRLHYEVDGGGPAILLSHGFAATSAMFQPNIAALAEAHTVITWDLRGHGDSDSPTDPAAYTADQSVADMAALLDQAGAHRAVIAGHSLGGYLSLEFQRAHPKRTAGLILIDTGPGYRSDSARAGWNEMAERYANRLEERGLAGLPSGDELGAATHRRADGLVLAARHLMTQRDGHVLESLGSIALPVLVIVGGDDEPFLAGARYMAEKIPSATLEVIDGARHAPNITHADLFNALVVDFLDRVEGADASEGG
jgi:pimeloyl-ACP methyl ester carboxylesterase